jgi:pSer/pThr/pTyr-binding forkhead associated (FHA) protein
MNPRLTAIAGRLKGSVFAIEELPVVIGRETAATLCVADASISRRHSKIEKEDDQFVILDLDSLNGTFINDVPVKRRVLQHGDRVRIGDSQFLFLLSEGDVVSKSNEVQFEEGQVVSGSTLQLKFNDAVYLMARDLSALMKVSTTINAIRGVDEIQRTLLELLFEVVPAERGVVLLTAGNFDGRDLQFSSVFGLDRRRGPDASITVSRTITHSVLRHGESLLISSPAEANQLEAASLIADHPTSLMCVPLKMMERTLGVIYLDTKEPWPLKTRGILNISSARTSA